MIYDTIIVGAGPAGAVLAYDLAVAGYKTLLIEKYALPRYKSCAGGVPLKSLKELPFDVDPVIEKSATGGYVNYKGKRLLNVELKDDFAWTVMRDKFDHFLTQKAVEAGAELLEETRLFSFTQDVEKVTVKTNKGVFQGRFLCGADGVNSIVAKTAGLLKKRKTGAAIEVEVKVPPEALKEHGDYASFDFGSLPHGYGWIFPKREHLSVGIFYAKAKKMPDLKQFMEQFFDDNPVLRDHEIIIQRGHRIPLGGWPQTLHNGRVLLAGDAANLADAWMGEGIYYAIKSANLAADVLQRNLKEGTVDLSEYSELVRKNITNDLLFAKLFAKLVYNMPRFCSFMIQRSLILQYPVFNTISGKVSFKQLTGSLLLKFPRVVFEALFYKGDSSYAKRRQR